MSNEKLLIINDKSNNFNDKSNNEIDEMARIIDNNHGFIVSSVKTAKALYEQGYRKQSEWISVKDRLPDCEQGAESEAVLFITKQGFMYTGYYGCGGIFHDRYFREFKNATEGYDISNVTHWMPLPEPPKEE